MRIGGFEIRFGLDQATGDTVIRAGWHRYHGVMPRSPSEPRAAADLNATLADLTADLAGQVKAMLGKTPNTDHAMLQAVLDLSPADLRRLRYTAVWHGLNPGWQILMMFAIIGVVASFGIPLLFTAMGFVLKGWAGVVKAVDVVFPAAGRMLVLAVPTYLLIRAAAERFASLPLHNRCLMQEVWGKAFGTTR